MKIEPVIATFCNVAYRIPADKVIDWCRAIKSGTSGAEAAERFGKRIKGRVESVLDWTADDAQAHLEYHCTEDPHRSRKGYFKP